MKVIKNEVWLNKIVQDKLEHEERLSGLKRVIKNFFKKWPGECPHNKEKCQVPPHPACIQVLDRPPKITPTPEMGPRPRRTTFGLESSN